MENNGLNEKINALRKEKNAVILAHYYQVAEIQDIADFVGDSRTFPGNPLKQTPMSLFLRVFILWQKQLKFYRHKREYCCPI